MGLAAGLLVYRLLRHVDNYQVEVPADAGPGDRRLRLADALHVSAPIAVVVAGLFIGNRGRPFAMSATTRSTWTRSGN